MTIARVRPSTTPSPLIEKECKRSPCRWCTSTHEGFGRALITVGKLVAVDRTLHDVYRFGFASLLQDEGRDLKILSVAP